MSSPDFAAEAFGGGDLGYAARPAPVRKIPGWKAVFAARPAGAPVAPAKRAFDLVVSILLLALVWPVLLATAVVLLIAEGRPVFYVAERMAAPGSPFYQIKFRTMRLGADAVGGVTGGDKARDISRLHRVLRLSRLDELPQLWNVIRGDMSLVGPRPPLRHYVEAYPELYARVLQSRPGMTGLATLRFHAREERILAACATPEETDAAYRRACIPPKARLDLIYQRRRTLALDCALVAETALRPIRHAVAQARPEEAPRPAKRRRMARARRSGRGAGVPSQPSS